MGDTINYKGAALNQIMTTKCTNLNEGGMNRHKSLLE